MTQPAPQTASAYFENIRARDHQGLLALFAADATLILPGGRALHGRDAIAAMYHSLFAAAPPFPTPANVVVGGNQCAVEIESQIGDQIKRTANFFTLDQDGKILRLVVYSQ
jgi:uncharacterized protein (TIGR02246 family)